MTDGARVLLKLVLIGGIALTVVAVGMIFALNQQQKSEYEARKVVVVERSDPNRADAQSRVKTLVPKSRIPQSVEDAKEAAALTLVPGRWQDDPNKRARAAAGPDADAVDIPGSERRAIAQVLDKFLATWETYTPGTVQDFNEYKRALAATVSGGNLSSVAKREDNHQPPRVCPRPGCTVGSIWDEGSSYESMTVRAFENDRAWVTTVGPVALRAFDRSDVLDRGKFLRSYGILLERDGDRWLVTRAAADTIDVLPVYE